MGVEMPLRIILKFCINFHFQLKTKKQTNIKQQAHLVFLFWVSFGGGGDYLVKKRKETKQKQKPLTQKVKIGAYMYLA